MKEKDILEFELDGQLYGTVIDTISEIVEKPEITPLPSSDDETAGIIELRGSTVPVKDPKEMLNLSKTNSYNRVIIFEKEDTTVGWLVDEVTQVTEIDESEVQTKINTGNSVNGVYNSGENFTIIVEPGLESTVETA